MTAASDIQRLREAVTPLPEGVPESWLTEDCLDRFLRADGHDFDKAVARLRGTLQWRASTRPEKISCSACAKDPHAHYMYQVGFAKSGQPVIYSDISLAADKSVPGNVEHCIQTLERSIATMQGGVESYIWVCDFHGFSISDCDPRMARGCLSLFAQHYPERMGAFIMVEAPYLFNTLWKLLSPHIDPVTAKKLVFVKGPSGKGGGEDLDKALGDMFDDELLTWLQEEMAENRKGKPAKAKSINVAHERGDGVFFRDSKHDCRGHASFRQTPAAAIVSGQVHIWGPSNDGLGSESPIKHSSSSLGGDPAATVALPS